MLTRTLRSNYAPAYLEDIVDGQNLLAKCLKGLTIMREGLLQADVIKTDRVMSSLLSK